MNFGVLLLKPFFPHVRFVIREAVTPSYFLAKSRAERVAARAGWRILYPSAALVISPAQAILDEFIDMGSWFKNQAVLPNPVDTAFIRSGGAEKRSAGVHFVCAGRLDPQKGFDRLIEALPRMPAQTEWRLTIIGEGPQRPALEALIARHNLRDRVELAGYISTPWPKIAAADAFLMPSRHEGLPNAVLEALDCGTPVIATAESGGIAEIASKASPSSVTIVGNMDEFIAQMSKFAPRKDEGLRPSLLPREYEKTGVVKRFEELLAQTGGPNV